MRYVDVYPATKTQNLKAEFFSYGWPFESEPQLGQLVFVPFGKRLVYGVISNIDAKPAAETKIKNVEKIVSDSPFIPEPLFRFMAWLAREYQVAPGQIVKSVLPKVLQRPRKKKIPEIHLSSAPHAANDAQAQALVTLKGSLNKSDADKPYLLHGITGSGKTEIYLQLATEALQSGKQVLILVPEISLTPQAVERFAQRFGKDQIAIWGSFVSPSEKWHNWQAILNGEKNIVLGPRSSIFTPLFNLGLIVVDEEHDSSYKQYDANPRYDARRSVEALADIHKAVLVYGDATPTVERFYQAAKVEHVLSLPQRAVTDSKLPDITVVDMREELRASNFSIFSRQLEEAMQQELAAGGQVLLFLNRRGISTVVLCRDCGLAVTCNYCNVPMIYHRGESGEELVCHHCGFVRDVPKTCPRCESPRIKFLGSGTQKVEAEAKRLFPNARVGRLDRDVTAKKGAQEKIYQDFKEHALDILVGTEMIARGWDLPNIGVVGVMLADSSLHFPDYRSGERTFQLITQVAGRTGRGAKPGQVFLQTYQPESRIIQAASSHDYAKLYEAEIVEREKHFYPPFSRLVKLMVRGKEKAKTLESAREIAEDLKRDLPQVQVLGPAPAFISRLRGLHRYQIILKLPAGSAIPELLKNLPPNVEIDIDPEDLL